MTLIASDSQRYTTNEIASMLEGYPHPAVLISRDYQIMAINQKYKDAFGELTPGKHQQCYEVSHGYDVPCDQAGESCPLANCQSSGGRERVLHIHNTPRGKEYVDVEMLPVFGRDGTLRYFVEMLKPLEIASAETSAVQMVGRSKAFNEMLHRINLVAKHHTSVLLLGESGTGKELAAKAIHSASNAADKPIVIIECAGLPETLFESELFGHVKGAFTGATQAKPGLLESVEGGTLFLDEIGDIPLGMQIKLLRLLETNTYRPVGSTEVKHASFRLICATHKNLSGMVSSGEFRQDLYFRINAFPVHLPSLNERVDDIPLLADSLLKKLSPKNAFQLTESATQLLKKHHYTGNIRELRNILERVIIFAKSSMIDATVLQKSLQMGVESETIPHDRSGESWATLRENERTYIKELLNSCSGDKQRAAQIAGVSLRSLYRKLKSDY